MARHPLPSVARIWLGPMSERLHLRMALCSQTASSKPRAWPGKWSTSRLQIGVETPCLMCQSTRGVTETDQTTSKWEDIDALSQPNLFKCTSYSERHTYQVRWLGGGNCS